MGLSSCVMESCRTIGHMLKIQQKSVLAHLELAWRNQVGRYEGPRLSWNGCCAPHDVRSLTSLPTARCAKDADDIGMLTAFYRRARPFSMTIDQRE